MYGALLKSTATEQELLELLWRPRFANKLPPWFLPEVYRILDATEAVQITEVVAICCNPTEDKFIELAINGGADPTTPADYRCY